MGQFGITRHRLQETLLVRLREFPGCDGAQGVVVRRLPDRKSQINWGFIVFDSGSSHGVSCRNALTEIYARAANQYELVGIE